MQILNLKNVSAFRGRTEALKGISFSIEKGEHTAVIGPNGAGKSSLLKLITREIYPVAGDDCFLEIFGQRHWNVWDLRKRLGLVSLDLQTKYLPAANGWTVVLSGYFASIGHVDEAKLSHKQTDVAKQLATELRIEHLMARAFCQMSTGEQRRCILGRALVNDPSVLVFDEPTVGLDPASSFHFFETVEALMEQGKTIVLVTHHIHEIVPEMNRVIMLKAGEVFCDGAKEGILTDVNLSSLFEVPVQVAIENGYFHAVPKRQNK